MTLLALMILLMLLVAINLVSYFTLGRRWWNMLGAGIILGMAITVVMTEVVK